MFIVIFCAQQFLPVIQGKKDLDILPFIRPFILASILAAWPTLCTGIFNAFATGSDAMAEKTIEKWDKTEKKIDSYMDLYKKAADLYYQGELANAATADENTESSKSILDEISGWINNAFVTIKKKFIEKILGAIGTALTNLVWLIGIVLLNLSVAGILFGAVISLCVMAFLGPIVFGMSVLDQFKDAWTKWVTNFMSICLYPIVCFLVVYLMSFPIDSSIKDTEAKVKKFETLVKQHTNGYSEDAATWNEASDELKKLAADPFQFVMLQVILVFTTFAVVGGTPTYVGLIVPGTASVSISGIINPMDQVQRKFTKR